MALILIIDVCLPTGYVVLAKDQLLLDSVTNSNQQKHAQWLHTAIDALLKKNNALPTELTHIAVTTGPGSYTGIRVGLSAAKGLAFALQIPIIPISSLALIAFANKTENIERYIPMVDARRNEVYTGIYNADLNLTEPEFSHIIHDNSFADLFILHKILICGTAGKKFSELVLNANCTYSYLDYNLDDLTNLTFSLLEKKEIIKHNNLVANYIKPYYSTTHK